MTAQRSSRSKRLFELGRIGMESLIREPVRESVRQALAEERILAEDQVERTRQQDDEPGDGNRVLRPVLLLPVLGLAAAVILRRRRLLEFAEEKDVIAQVDEAIPTHATNQRTAADSEPTEIGTQSDYGGSEDVPDGTRPSGFGNVDDDTDGANDYEADDTDDTELSTPE